MALALLPIKACLSLPRAQVISNKRVHFLSQPSTRQSNRTKDHCHNYKDGLELPKNISVCSAAEFLPPPVASAGSPQNIRNRKAMGSREVGNLITCKLKTRPVSARAIINPPFAAFLKQQQQRQQMQRQRRHRHQHDRGSLAFLFLLDSRQIHPCPPTP